MRARQSVVERFSLAAMVRGYEQVYQAVLNRLTVHV
jgi:hypothetical protein